MDLSHGDRVSRFFAQRRLSRRQALSEGGVGLAVGVFSAAGLTAVAGQEATPASDAGAGSELPEYLFVQSFEGGSIVPTEGDDGRYTVTLDHGLGQTIYFTDRPDRIVGTLPTDRFLHYLGFTPGNPPNAALVLQRGAGDTDIAVVELFDPVYDASNANATYTVQVLEEWENSVDMAFAETTADLATLAPDFGAAHLFIDGLNDCPDGAVSCYTSNADGTRGQLLGTIPGSGTMGYCSPGWESGACFPCVEGDPKPSYWVDQCNATYAACNGNCFLWNFCSRDNFTSSHEWCKNSDVGGTWIGW